MRWQINGASRSSKVVQFMKCQGFIWCLLLRNHSSFRWTFIIVNNCATSASWDWNSKLWLIKLFCQKILKFSGDKMRNYFRIHPVKAKDTRCTWFDKFLSNESPRVNSITNNGMERAKQNWKISLGTMKQKRRSSRITENLPTNVAEQLSASN